MAKGIFIVGTDTDVGKTVVTAGLTLCLRARGLSVGVMKPIATGCRIENDRLVSDDAAFIAAAAGETDLDLVNPIRFELPLAPSIAAELTSTAIDRAKIHQVFSRCAKKYSTVIVEGIGGLFVPLNNNYCVRDLISELQIPVIVVGRLGLGTINHTLMTVALLQETHIPILGVILNTTHEGAISIAEKTNPAVVKALSGVPLLGVLPWIAGLDIPAKRCGSLQSDFERSIDLHQCIRELPHIPGFRGQSPDQVVGSPAVQSAQEGQFPDRRS